MGKLLQKIIESIEHSRNVQEKRSIDRIVQKIDREGYKGEGVHASIGEDSAALNLSRDFSDFILVSTDALLPAFIRSNPWAAGFSAVYVGVDDIIASGGLPIACTTTVEFGDPALGEAVFNGILDGTKRFKTPLIRGHTTTDSDQVSLTSTVIGKTDKNSYISVKDTKLGDFIGLVFDQEGEPGRVNRLYWNSITHKSTADFFHKREFIRKSKSSGFLHSCKDVSNGGIFGTLYQFLIYSDLGARINIDLFEKEYSKLNFSYSPEEFLFLFLTSAFLVSFPPIHSEGIKKFVKESNMTFIPLGNATKAGKITIFDEEREYSIGI